MIEYIKGQLAEKNPAFAVIETQGIGYYIHISLFTYEKLPKEASACNLFIHQQIKEDAHALYGFADRSEREVFRQLISVSGVGTSTAQMMLSSLGPEQVRGAITREDVETLKAVKGIGAKTAQRVIVDLKDKLNRSEEALEISRKSDNTSREEALSALVALGFDHKSIHKVLDKLIRQDEELSVEELVKRALRSF